MLFEFYSCILGSSNYLISNTGTVPNKTTGKTIKPFITSKGYRRTEISDNDKNRRKFLVHRLVVSTFGYKNGNREIDSHSDINHIDRNKLNNCKKIVIGGKLIKKCYNSLGDMCE